MRGKYIVKMPTEFDYCRDNGKVAKDRWHLFSHLCRLLYGQGLDYSISIKDGRVIITAKGEAVRALPNPIRWSNGELINLSHIMPGRTSLEVCTANKLGAIELAESVPNFTTWTNIDGRYQEVGRNPEEVLAEYAQYREDVEYWTEMERLALPVEVRLILEKEDKSCRMSKLQVSR